MIEEIVIDLGEFFPPETYRELDRARPKLKLTEGIILVDRVVPEFVTPMTREELAELLKVRVRAGVLPTEIHLTQDDEYRLFLMIGNGEAGEALANQVHRLGIRSLDMIFGRRLFWDAAETRAV